MTRIALITVPGLKLIEPGDDLPCLIQDALGDLGEALADGDIIVVAQKIVSKAEGRFVDLRTVTPGGEAERVAAETGKDARLVEIVLSQSRRIVRMRPGVLIVEHKLGWIMANAGVDHSNIEGADHRVLLLPDDPDASAAALRLSLMRTTGVRLGVVINDSFGRPWRQGTTGVAIGVAGLPALIDRRGDPDLYGRPLQATIIGHADEIAAAASLVMGPADEALPVVIVRGLHPATALASTAAPIIRAATEDLFR